MNNKESQYNKQSDWSDKSGSKDKDLTSGELGKASEFQSGRDFSSKEERRDINAEKDKKNDI